MKLLRLYCCEPCTDKYWVKLQGALYNVSLTHAELIDLHCNSVPKGWEGGGGNLTTPGCQMSIPTYLHIDFQK